MKKKVLAGALALLVMLGLVTVGSAGSQSDPLISLSYLTGTFFSDLKAYVTQWVARGTQGLYDDAVTEGQTPDGWTVSSGFVPGEGEYGDTVTLATGSGLIWSSGSGAVSSGVLVDATSGTELRAGRALTVGHRYLAAEDTVVVASSQAQWMTEGKWRRGAGGTVIVPLPFTDVPESAWYYDDVRFVVEKGLYSGVTDTLFDPGGSMERRMITTVLHRLAGEPEVSYSPVFSDIPDGQWYTRGTIWCAQMGIVGGVGGGRFDPTQTLTRQQIATILYNYAIKTGRTADEQGDLNVFSDRGSVASWAAQAMRWAVGVGIFNGNDEGKLLPNGVSDRAQVAAILHHYQNWLDAQ